MKQPVGKKVAKPKTPKVTKEEEKQVDQIQDGDVMMPAAVVVPVDQVLPKPIKKRAVKIQQIVIPPAVTAQVVAPIVQPKVGQGRKQKAKEPQPIVAPQVIVAP